MFASKAMSFPKSGECVRCSTWVGSLPYIQ
jgi:hypothetical protein